MSRERRTNPIPPGERIAVRRDDSADLFSISTSLFDELVAEGVFRPPKYVHSIPLWDVRQLKVAWKKFMGEDDDGSDPWSCAAL